jgi:anti-sigma regulatory factor (Ser/Thr protein kinase)
MQKEFKRHIESLKEIFRFTKSFINDEQLNQDLESALNLVLEELFTNMVKYSPNNPNKIKLEMKSEHDRVIIVITDYDVEPFDIREVAEYDIHQILKKRPVGKVGLHLVKEYVDDIDYEYKNRISEITLIKYLGKTHA